MAGWTILIGIFSAKSIFTKPSMYGEKPTEEAERCSAFSRKEMYLILFYNKWTQYDRAKWNIQYILVSLWHG